MATPQTGAGDPKRSLELLWREFEPQQSRPGPKPRLTVDRIVEAAIAVADREGSCFGMRSVSAELGVGAMTIYRYIPGKKELIDLMVDRISRFDGVEPDLTRLDWREGLELLAEGTWEVYEAHPWLLEINQRRPVLGPDSLAGYDFALSAFEGHDLPDREKNLVVTSVMNLVTGTARQYLLGDSADDAPETTESEWWDMQAPYLEKAVASGRYPRITVFSDEEAWDITAHESMRYLLDRFLDGLAPRMEAVRRAPRSPGGAAGDSGPTGSASALGGAHSPGSASARGGTGSAGPAPASGRATST
jgi:AcrR family transcriptional regulator